MFNTGLPTFVCLSLSFIFGSSNYAYARPVPSTAPQTVQFTVPQLPYGYSDLEPAISTEIMKLHHEGHHTGYVKALNTAMEAYALALAANDLLKQIELQPAIRFNGGGHINHSDFWKILQPLALGGGQLKSGSFAQAVQQEFGDLEHLKASMNKAGMGLQGSGWLWLAHNKNEKRLEILTTPNQDTLTAPLVPIINIDMWEHSYYLQHKNRKADYLTQVWTVINFDEAEARYKAAST